MSYEQGHIVIVPFPNTDQTEPKPRPAVIVSNNRVNEGQDVMLAYLTSQEKRGGMVVILDSEEDFRHEWPDWMEVDTSYCMCKRIVTMDKELIQKSINRVTDEKLQEILEKVTLAFDPNHGL